MATKQTKKSDQSEPHTGAKLTPLGKHRRSGKMLQSPIHELENFNFSSWRDLYLPDALWAVLLAGQLSRDRCLEVFRLVLGVQQSNAAEFKGTSLAHSSLAHLGQPAFGELFKEITAMPDVGEALSPLMLIECLPDRERWAQLLPDTDRDSETAVTQLAASVSASFNHQSQQATDCRWLRLMSLVVRRVILFDSKMKERAEQLHHYPNRGDMRSVRPFIRAGEIGTRSPDLKMREDTSWTVQFWQECYNKTGCIPYDNRLDDETPDYSWLFNEVLAVYSDLMDHFLSTTETTGISPKHDGAFGLAFYVMQLLVFGMNADVGRTTQGRILLRSAFEAFVNLRYLADKDDPTLWLTYRNYGSGQAKLAYLKNINRNEAPSFVNLDDLETYANEDMWIEFQDVKIGAWADKNLRQLAIDAGIKDLYDQYYDILSGYVHANWIAVRDAIFVDCVNPLHRFHRIPMPPRIGFPDVIPDVVELANRGLVEIASLYPPFDRRIAQVVPDSDHPNQSVSGKNASEKK